MLAGMMAVIIKVSHVILHRKVLRYQKMYSEAVSRRTNNELHYLGTEIKNK